MAADDIPTYDADAGGVHLAGGNPGNPYLADELGGGSGGDDAGKTILELLEEELTGEEQVEELPPIALGRNPDYIVVYAKITDGDVIDKARKASRDPKRADGVDGPKFAALICSQACARIIRRGTVLVDDQGRPLRFNHRLLLEAFHARSVADCTRRFYGDDADMDAAARRIMIDSGWGKEAADAGDVMDPPPAG